MILNGNVLGANHLFGRHGKECSGFYRGIIHNQHEQASMNSSQAGDYPGGGSAAPLFVHLIGGVDTQLKKFGITVNEQVNSLAGGKTSFTVLRLDGFLPSA